MPTLLFISQNINQINYDSKSEQMCFKYITKTNTKIILISKCTRLSHLEMLYTRENKFQRRFSDELN